MKNQQWADQLKEAKTRLASGVVPPNWRIKKEQVPFICYSLDLKQPSRDLRVELHRRLQTSCIEYFLYEKGLIPTPQYSWHQPPEICIQIQEYRHRWVDELIKEFESA